MVCYGWKERQAEEKNTLAVVKEHNLRILRNVLESPYPEASGYVAIQARDSTSPSADEANFALLQKTYLACKDIKAIAAVGTKPLKAAVAELDRIWPAAGDAAAPLRESDYDNFVRALVFLEDLGVPSFYEGLADADDAQPDANVAFFRGPKFSQPDSVYSDPAALGAYSKTLAGSLRGVLPLNLSDAEALAVGTAVARLEADLRGALAAGEGPPPDLPPNTDAAWVAASYFPYTPAAVASLSPVLRLDKLVAALGPAGYKPEKIVLQVPNYFRNVSVILAKTPKLVVQAYLASKTVARLSDVVVTPDADERILLDPLRCAAYVDEYLKFSLGRFFVTSSFGNRSRDYGDQMMHEVREAFVARVGGLDWMTDGVKKQVVQKAKNVRQMIGYPTSSPDLLDAASVAEYHRGLKITNDFFANTAELGRWNRQKRWGVLGRPVDAGAFAMSVAETNAYYRGAGNTITVLAGIMQFPVFSPDLPAYANFGSLGTILGHELSHGFDNTGRHYNPDGKLATYWDEATAAAFEEKSRCFVEQYGAMKVGDRNVDGELTLGENLADAGGLNTAYAAWKARTKGVPEQKLPGLEHLTPEQLFFVFFANTWCNNFSPAAVAAGLTDEHAPDSARILGTAANSAAFREAFNCPVKKPTCEVW